MSQVHVICCSGPPTIVPQACGQHWIDTLNRVTYLSVGTASIADWLCEDQKVIKIMDCAASVAVDDLVYQSGATDNLAVTAVDNTTLQPIVGIVIAKPTTTTCVVQVKGIVAFTISRGRVFLSATGTPTITAPVAGYIQDIGWACGAGRMEINPVQRRIKLV